MNVATRSLFAAHWLDWLNILLLLLSGLLAFFLPFETFLVAYGLLGPLHYLTEIFWLHEKQFFLPSTSAGRPLFVWVGLATAAVGAGLVFLGSVYTGLLSGLYFLVVALALLLVIRPTGRLPSVFSWSVLAVLALVVPLLPGGAVVFGLLLPTLLHVYVFTAVFMLTGSLKTRSIPGLGAVGLLAGIGLLLLASGSWSGPQLVAASSWATTALHPANDFSLNGLHEWLYGVINGKPGTANRLFYSPTGIAVGRFVAFAYTYHYLNWFSKTSLIKWHKLGAGMLGGVGGLWLGAVMLYLVDYNLGLKALFFLSLLHVLLELPLNLRSIRNLLPRFRAEHTRLGQSSP
jgi:hypothetical protein